MRNAMIHRRKPSGFSLIEVIFAIAMLGIGIVGVLSLFTAGLTSASKAANSSSASMEVQSLLTRILTESDGDGTKPVSHRLVLDRINVAGNPPGTNAYPWIHFETKLDGSIAFSDSEKPARIDPKRDLFWKCLCRPVHSDRDATGAIVAWYPPLNPDDPFDSSYKDASAARDSTGKEVFVNGLYEVAIAIYRTQKDDVPTGQKPIQWYTTFVTAGF
jgi:prepilin-type N-terminal cleavage/methylation domain-containing protein